MDFGHNLVRIRTERGVSRKELAERLGIPYTTLRNYENGEREPGHKTLIAISNIFGITVDELIGNTMKGDSAPPSPDAMKVAVAYDQADEKSRKIAWLALEDFMETPVPAMAQRRTNRMAADDEPNSRRVLDEQWSEWQKKHPNAKVIPGEGFSTIVVVDPYKMGTENDAKSAEPLHRYQFVPYSEYSEKSDNGKTEHSSCAQCPLAGRCSQRFSEKPFPGLRFNLQVVNSDGKKEPPVLLSEEECPLYYLLKRTAPKSASGELILLDENGKLLLPAGNIDLSAILGMINPALQRELSKAMNPSGDNGDDSEKT